MARKGFCAQFRDVVARKPRAIASTLSPSTTSLQGRLGLKARSGPNPNLIQVILQSPVSFELPHRQAERSKTLCPSQVFLQILMAIHLQIPHTAEYAGHGAYFQSHTAA